MFAAKVSSFSHEMGKLPGMERGTVSVYEKDVPFLGNYEEVAKVAYEPRESIDEEKLVADIEAYMQNRKVYDFNQSITERWSMSDKGKQKGTEKNRVQSVFSLDKCTL